MVSESAFSNDPQVRRKAYTLAEKGYQVVIEDCVHVLGALCYRQQVGTFGRAAFFSTEETKIISTTMGGMNIVLFHQLSNRR
ncbi:MAG: DegT/DnrJ/EryC1/StrS family aminotransferase [Proteobacteria bacterium]|nr:DegT/DnrJ/EryC1/StrS family aminotransferase [Pseudomonadota bacterium]